MLILAKSKWKALNLIDLSKNISNRQQPNLDRGSKKYAAFQN
jgi:hypothetical protein